MNFRTNLKSCPFAALRREKDFFDFQAFRALKWSNRQPDLETVVRLFLKNLCGRSCRFFKVERYFEIFYSRKNEALLGSNRKNLEIRLWFYQTDEWPGRVILHLAISYLNMIGLLQSFYIRILFFLLFPSINRSLGNLTG